ncbi:MAG: hypothetical protein ACRECO_01200 [Xanthobacteraceae bacterium]
MNRILAILTATAFVAVLGGASMTEPAHSATKSASKSQQTKKASKTKKTSKRSTKRGAKQAEQVNSPHAAFQFNVLEPLAMMSTCQDQGNKRGLSGQQYWDFVGACTSRRGRR